MTASRGIPRERPTGNKAGTAAQARGEYRAVDVSLAPDAALKVRSTASACRFDTSLGGKYCGTPLWWTQFGLRTLDIWSLLIGCVSNLATGT
jgi:hypothetical protein